MLKSRCLFTAYFESFMTVPRLCRSYKALKYVKRKQSTLKYNNNNHPTCRRAANNNAGRELQKYNLENKMAVSVKMVVVLPPRVSDGLWWKPHHWLLSADEITRYMHYQLRPSLHLLTSHILAGQHTCNRNTIITACLYVYVCVTIIL